MKRIVYFGIIVLIALADVAPAFAQGLGYYWE